MPPHADSSFSPLSSSTTLERQPRNSGILSGGALASQLPPSAWSMAQQLPREKVEEEPKRSSRASLGFDRLTSQFPTIGSRSWNEETTTTGNQVAAEAVKRRPSSKSISGAGSNVKLGFGSRLRRASETIKSRFQLSSGKTEGTTSNNASSSDSFAGRKCPDSTARRSRPLTAYGDLSPMVRDLSIATSVSQTSSNGPFPASRDTSQGAAARASAARENQRNNAPRSIVRVDSNVGLVRLDRSRESGISISTDACSTAGSASEVQSGNKVRRDSDVLRKDPLSYLPAELSTLIFSFLDAPSLACASLVARPWHHLTSDPFIWRAVFLRKFGPGQSTSSPLASVGGSGLGKTGRIEQDWKTMYNARQELARNWRTGNATAVYLSGHTDSVYCLQYDEKKIVTGCRDRTIRVWDIKTFKCIKVIGIPSAINTDRREQATSANPEPPQGAIKSMKIYRVPHLPPDPSIYHVPIYYHHASILCLQYDDEIMVTGSSDNTLIVWDISTFQPTGRLVRHRSGVLDVAFDKQKIVSCSKDATLCIWSRHDGQLLQQLEGHRGPVNAVQLRGNLIVSASGEGCARLWNLNLTNRDSHGFHIQAKCIKEFWSADRGLACVEFSADARYILAGGNDQVIYKFDTSTGETVATLKGHENLVRSLYLDGANGRVISGSYDLGLRVWDFETGEPVGRFSDATESWLLAAKGDYRRLVATSQNGRVVVLDFGWAVRGVELLEG